MESLIEAENLYRYYGDRCAVRGLGISLKRGDVLGLLGPNGAGKSTTLRMLTGNLTPSAGRVRIQGADLRHRPVEAKAALGYLPEPPPLYPELRVDEYLRYCARLHRMAVTDLTGALDRVKRLCGLEAVGRRLIRNLSRGFRQRLGIAQAIVHRPELIVLDEPSVGLDPKQIHDIRALIRELGRSHGVILSTHLLSEVHSVCTRVQILHHGRAVYATDLSNPRPDPDPPRLLLGLEQAPQIRELAELSGVQDVEALGGGRYRLHLASGADPRSAIARSVVRWGLVELREERRTLEQIFLDLTSGEAIP
jgi:ABC-2 type transport system ATP-binding protein